MIHSISAAFKRGMGACGVREAVRDGWDQEAAAALLVGVQPTLWWAWVVIPRRRARVQPVARNRIRSRPSLSENARKARYDAAPVLPRNTYRRSMTRQSRRVNGQ